MISSPSLNSESYTESRATTSDVGLEISDSERTTGSLRNELSTMASSPGEPALSPELISGCGTPKKPLTCSTDCAIHGPMLILSNGSIGQQIVDADGRTVAWTTDLVVAQVICGLMNDFTNNNEKGV